MTSVILPPSPNWWEIPVMAGSLHAPELNLTPIASQKCRYASHLADVAAGLHAFCAHNSIVVADAHDSQVRDVLRGHANR